MALNLDIIQRCYPDSIIMDIEEIYYPIGGWVDTKNQIITPYTSIEEVIKRLNACIDNGAEWINFKLMNEFEQICYPDYRVKELLG